jgi:serine/threonine protein kinase
MYSYCPNCQKLVTNEHGRCQDCASEVGVGRGDSPFLSGGSIRRTPYLELELGSILLERFELKKKIGNGSFGTVYRAYDRVRSEEVAVKIVEVGPCSPEIAAMQLQREISLYGRIEDHRYIIRIHDIHFMPRGGNGLLLMSMEYAVGGTFRKWLLKNREDWEKRRTEGLDLFKEACYGVSAIHDVGLAHLDLKPENLLFNGRIKVSDFGSASFAQNLQSSSGFSWRISTPELCTPGYMSPEHFVAPHPEDIDSRADIYSLGSILYEILHPQGRPPFGGSPERIRELHLRAPTPHLPIEVGPRVGEIVARCLQKDPANRYQNVRQLLEDLEGRGSDFSCRSSEREQTSDEQTSEKAKCRMDKAFFYVSERRFKEAESHCNLILEQCPDHDDARQMLDELERKYKEADRFYSTIEQDINSRELSELTDLAQEASRIYPDHPSRRFVQSTLATRARRYKEAMKQGTKAAQGGCLESALACFLRAKELNPGSTMVETVVRILSKELLKGERGDISGPGRHLNPECYKKDSEERTT